eukprot:Gb_31547 [translate_table: standard]
MYAKCGNIEIACQLFDKMPEKNVVSWNAMIAGYVHNGYAKEGLTLSYQMLVAHTKSNSVTALSVLPTCADCGALQQGKWVHAYVIRCGFEFDSVLQTALMDLYAKCGNTEIARYLFDKMSKSDVILWNAMIAGYAQNGEATEALTLFNHMLLIEKKPDCVTMMSVLPACANSTALQQGMWLYIIKNGLESNVSVATALIDIDRIAWNAMIAGYAQNGHAKESLTLFSWMKLTDLKPNLVTMVSVLPACASLAALQQGQCINAYIIRSGFESDVCEGNSLIDIHPGLVDKGRQIFDCMSREYCITPKVDHYARMADLLGRAGNLDEAQNFIESMPFAPSANVWGALLGVCRIHGNSELGERVAKHLFELEPENDAYYVLLLNIYAAEGRWGDVAKLRTMMQDRGLKKMQFD